MIYGHETIILQAGGCV